MDESTVPGIRELARIICLQELAVTGTNLYTGPYQSFMTASCTLVKGLGTHLPSPWRCCRGPTTSSPSGKTGGRRRARRPTVIPSPSSRPTRKDLLATPVVSTGAKRSGETSSPQRVSPDNPLPHRHPERSREPALSVVEWGPPRRSESHQPAPLRDTCQPFRNSTYAIERICPAAASVTASRLPAA